MHNEEAINTLYTRLQRLSVANFVKVQEWGRLESQKIISRALIVSHRMAAAWPDCFHCSNDSLQSVDIVGCVSLKSIYFTAYSQPSACGSY